MVILDAPTDWIAKLVQILMYQDRFCKICSIVDQADCTFLHILVNLSLSGGGGGVSSEHPSYDKFTALNA